MDIRDIALSRRGYRSATSSSERRRRERGTSDGDVSRFTAPGPRFNGALRLTA